VIDKKHLVEGRRYRVVVVVEYGKDRNVTNRAIVEFEVGGSVTATIVTATHLNSLNWSNVSSTMIDELNRVLTKYEINTTERVRHFLAQCMKETNRGAWLREGEYLLNRQDYTQEDYENYFNQNTRYGYLYRGSGYIQITWKYGYQAFATFMIRQAHPNLGIEWRSPNNTDADRINGLYEVAVQTSERNGLNIEKYKQIVSRGADYVANEFAWEAAGYYWASANLNNIVDGLRPGNALDVDSVTAVINRYTPAQSYAERRGFYSETISVIR